MPLKRHEYLKLRLNELPEDVIEHYGLKNEASPEEFVYVEVRKGMYGLPQAGLLAQELLEKQLNEKDIGNQNTHLAFGCMIHKQSNSR